jgi:Rod binding domain-containing protein
MGINASALSPPGSVHRLTLSELQASFKHPQDAQHKKLKKAAQDFESVFFQQLLTALDKTIDRSNEMFSGGQAEDTFRGMMNQEVAKLATASPAGSGFGLAQTVYQQLSEKLAASPHQDPLAGSGPIQ